MTANVWCSPIHSITYAIIHITYNYHFCIISRMTERLSQMLLSSFTLKWKKYFMKGQLIQRPCIFLGKMIIGLPSFLIWFIWFIMVRAFRYIITNHRSIFPIMAGVYFVRESIVLYRTVFVSNGVFRLDCQIQKSKISNISFLVTKFNRKIKQKQ